MTLRQMLGQKLIFGFHGTELDREFIDLVREYQIGNVILFLRNARSAPQLRRLCRDIQALIRAETGQPAFIVIDQEGGMVSRLPPDAVNVPGAMALAATGRVESARLASEITIRQLRGIGANFNMAPVLDVNSAPQNPVIGVRSFGDDPEAVSRFALAAAAPYAGSGVLCCGKHFPGHGDTTVDSHLGIPRMDKTLSELEALELIPFRRWAQAGMDAVMISHVMFPRIETQEIPCTLSRRFVTDLLRREMGFQGLILTDCMEMLAIQDHFGTPEGVVAAIRAGCDLAEISSRLDLQRRAAEALCAAAEQGQLDMAEIETSVERIAAFKQTICTDPAPDLSDLPEDRTAAEALSRAAITCWEGAPFPVNGGTFFCGCGDYRASGVGNESGTRADFPSHMGRSFSAPWALLPKDPQPQDIAAAVARAAQGEAVVLSLCNAHLFPGQLALAHALSELKKPLMAVALRDPYDLPLLPPCACKIAAFDYSLPALKALEDVFRGGEMTGRCPVRLSRTLGKVSAASPLGAKPPQILSQ